MESKANNTIQRIKEELLKMLRTMPIEQVQVKQLCERVGIGRSTFYLYFDSAYDVLEDIENSLLSEQLMYNKEHGIPISQDVRDEIHQTLCFLEEHREVYEPLLGKYGDISFQYKWARIISRRFQDLITADSHSDEWNECVITFVIGGVQKLASHWISHSDSLSQENAEDAFFSIIETIKNIK